MSDGFKEFMNWLATGIGLGVAAQIIPVVAGIFSILWLGTCLYDRWFDKGIKGVKDGD